MARTQRARRSRSGCFPLLVLLVAFYFGGHFVGKATGVGDYSRYSTDSCEITPPPFYTDVWFHVFWWNPADYAAAVATAYSENGTYEWGRTYDNGDTVDIGILMINDFHQADRLAQLGIPRFLLYLAPFNLYVAHDIWAKNGNSFRGPWYGLQRCGMNVP